MTPEEKTDARIAALEYMCGAALKLALEGRSTGWFDAFRTGMIEGVNTMTNLSTDQRGQVRLLLAATLLQLAPRPDSSAD